MPDSEKEKETPKTLKDGEVAVSEKDWDRIQAKAKDMDKYKAEAARLKEDVDDLQERFDKLETKAKTDQGEGADAKAVDAAVAEATAQLRKELDKAHKTAMADQERALKVDFAARLAMIAAGAKEVYVRSVDLTDVTDAEGAKERVEAFLKENPEVLGKQPGAEPPAPPGVTRPSTGPPPPGEKPSEGPKTPQEREKFLRERFRIEEMAVMRTGDKPKVPG